MARNKETQKAHSAETLGEWTAALSKDDKLRIDILEAWLKGAAPLQQSAHATLIPRSTADIIDELRDMVDLPLTLVARYMDLAGYRGIYCDDDRVKWAIWRTMIE